MDIEKQLLNNIETLSLGLMICKSLYIVFLCIHIVIEFVTCTLTLYIMITLARLKVKSRSHFDVAHL